MKTTTSIIAIATTLFLASPVCAQAVNATIATQETPLDAAALDDQSSGGEVLVLGTRRTDRTLTTSASPVDVIGSAELNTQPSGNMLDVIKNLVPSFYVPQNTITSAVGRRPSRNPARLYEDMGRSAQVRAGVRL